jgi:predicted nucleic acid-binding protein
MIAEPLEFVDTNVLVYAFDLSAGEKQTTAVRLLERLWNCGTGCLSVQILQEFYVTVTRKVALPLPVDEARSRVRELAVWRIFAPDAGDVLDAISLQQDARIGFWDAMVVLGASKLGCETLWSEDLTDGQVIRGVRIRNPFAPQPPSVPQSSQPDP